MGDFVKGQIVMAWRLGQSISKTTALVECRERRVARLVQHHRMATIVQIAEKLNAGYCRCQIADCWAATEQLHSKKRKICHYSCAYLILHVIDLPRWRPLHSQRSNTAASQPVPGELLRGMLQATWKSVWRGPGRREWRWGLAWHQPLRSST